MLKRHSLANVHHLIIFQVLIELQVLLVDLRLSTSSRCPWRPNLVNLVRVKSSILSPQSLNSNQKRIVHEAQTSQKIDVTLHNRDNLSSNLLGPQLQEIPTGLESHKEVLVFERRRWCDFAFDFAINEATLQIENIFQTFLVF